MYDRHVLGLAAHGCQTRGCSFRKTCSAHASKAIRTSTPSEDTFVHVWEILRPISYCSPRSGTSPRPLLHPVSTRSPLPPRPRPAAIQRRTRFVFIWAMCGGRNRRCKMCSHSASTGSVCQRSHHELPGKKSKMGPCPNAKVRQCCVSRGSDAFPRFPMPPHEPSPEGPTVGRVPRFEPVRHGDCTLLAPHSCPWCPSLAARCVPLPIFIPSRPAHFSVGSPHFVFTP